MTKFNPAMLIPASQVAGAAKGTPARTIQQIALDNINRMKAEAADPNAPEGRKNWKVVGDRVVFTVRISNTALILECAKVEGSDVEVEVREMTAPKANFSDALDYYADRIKAGEYDAQLAALGEKKTARQDKRRQNKEAKAGEAKTS